MILDKIIQYKKEEVADLLRNKPLINHENNLKSFLKILEKKQLHLIAEIKKASPSKGLIYESFYPIDLAKQFESYGASCISVLTDREFFKGSSDYLIEVKKAVDIPVLRKDFIIDPIQVLETKAMGADIMLVILDILSVDQANDIMATAAAHNLEVLLEIHGIAALEKLEDIDNPRIIGVNNRDLNTFNVNMNHVFDCFNVISNMHPKAKVIAESGYNDVEELKKLEKYGIDGVLIGEGLSKHNHLLEWFQNEG